MGEAGKSGRRRRNPKRDIPPEAVLCGCTRERAVPEGDLYVRMVSRRQTGASKRRPSP